MGPPSKLVGTLSLLFFVGGSFAGPVLKEQPSKCYRGLPVGKTFVYHYDGLNKIQNDDVNQDVKFSTEVIVAVTEACTLRVELKNVVSDHTKFSEALQKHPIQVHLDNGVVQGIRHHPSEPAWVVNIKRSVVSMMQAPLDARDASAEVTETDILGTCMTSYTSQPTDGDHAKITKTKKLLSCQGRFEEPSSVFFTPYDAKTSDIRTIPLADGTYICHQDVSKTTGVMKTASCKQNEKLYISNQAGTKPGVITVIMAETTMRLIREEDGAQSIPENLTKKSTLMFDHRYRHEETNTEGLILAIDRYCEGMKDDIRPETGKLYDDIITSMRRASFDKINGVYGSLESKECDSQRLRGAFMDALGLAGTSGAVRMMAHLMKEGRIEREEEWLASLSYLTSPTEEMIEAFVPLVKNTRRPKMVMLPVSAMAHTFCKLHGEDCHLVPAVRDLIKALTNHLKDSCDGDKPQVVAALKALGNLGQFGDAAETVMKCVNSGEVQDRLYALGAFRKVCDADITSKMLDIYSDMTEDSEVRIAAYLNTIKCAEIETIAKIIRVLEEEKIMQVGSYVYSHLSNLHESSCPLKEQIKQLINNFDITSTRFSSDPRKFSQHFEFSKYYDSMNIGAAADASIVFSPKSFLPRSAMFNLSLDLFSNSINILELGGRAEGLESVLEKLMGPRTPLGQELTSQLNRVRRATEKDSNVDKFDNEVPVEQKQQKMSFYVNIFGNEIDYAEFENVQELMQQLMISGMNAYKYHPSYVMQELMIEGEMNIVKNALLFDKKVSAATLSGVGVTTEMRAVTNVVIRAAAPMPTAENPELKASFTPSAVVQIDGSLTLDAGAFRHGVRIATTIHTSTVVDIKIINTDDEYTIRFNTPREKVELLNAKSEVFTIDGDRETRIEAEVTRDLDGCTQQLPELLGMTVCINGKVPKPWYLSKRGFVRPYNFNLVVEKSDRSMEGLEFSFKRIMAEDEGKIEISFDTPGSAVSRKHALTFRTVFDRLAFRTIEHHLSWACPHKTADLSVILSDGMVIGQVKAVIDGTKVYSLVLQNDLDRVDSDGPGMNLIASCPYIETPFRLSTYWLLNEKQTMRIVSNYPLAKPFDFTAAISPTYDTMSRTTKVNVETKLTSRWMDSTTTADITVTERMFHLLFATEYTLEGGKAQKANYELKTKAQFTEETSHITGVSSLTSTCHPDYNNKITFDLNDSGDDRKHKIQMWWGEKLNDEKTLRLNFDYKKKGDFGFGMMSTMQIAYQIYSPAWNTNWEGKFNTKADLQRSPRVLSELTMMNQKEVFVKFDFNFERSSPKTNIRASLVAPNTRLVYVDVSEEIATGKYQGITDIEWGFEGKKLTADYTCQLLQGGNHQVSVTLKVPGMKPVTHRHLIRVARDLEAQIDNPFVKLNIKKDDHSLHANYEGRRFDFTYDRTNENKIVDVKLEATIKSAAKPRKIIFTAHRDNSNDKVVDFKTALMLDGEASPDKKLSLSIHTERSSEGRKRTIDLDLGTLLNLAYKGSYNRNLLKGPNTVEIDLSGSMMRTRHITFGHSRTPEKADAYLNIIRDGQPLIDAKYNRQFTADKRTYSLVIQGVVNRKLLIVRDLAAGSHVMSIELDRDGKIYSINIDGRSGKGVIDNKVILKLPYPNYESQQLTSKGTYADGKIDVTFDIISASGKVSQIVVKGSRPKPRNAELEMTIKCGDKNGKGSLKYAFEQGAETTASAKVHVELDDKEIMNGDFNVQHKDLYNKHVTLKWSSIWTPSYLFDHKHTGDKTKAHCTFTVQKDGADGYITSAMDFSNLPDKKSANIKFHGPRTGDWTADVEFEVLPGNSHRAYKLNAKRGDRELKMDAETQVTDGYKETSINVCRTPLDADCVSVIVKRNKDKFHFIRNNELNVKIHRKPDVTLVMDGAVHIPEGNHHVHLRGVGAINEYKLGAELHCDHEGTVSSQSIRGYLVDREMLATRRREQNDKMIDIKYTATLDETAETPNRLLVNYKRDYNAHGYTSTASISHPKLRNSITLTSSVSKQADANSIIRVESELDWYKPEDKVFLHYERRLNDDIARNRSVHLHIHKEDKSDFNLHLTAYRSEDMQKPVFAGYYWSYITHKKETRVGQLKAFLGEDLKGSIEFESPYQDNFEIRGEAKQLNADGDKEAQIVHIKNGVETKGKINYNLNKAHMKAVVLGGDGNPIRELEIDGGKVKKGHYRFLLSTYKEGQKHTDIEYDLERTSDTAYHSTLNIPHSYIDRIAALAKDQAANRAGKYRSEDFIEEFQQRAGRVSFKVNKVFEDIPTHIVEEITKIFGSIHGAITNLLKTSVGVKITKLYEQHKELVHKIVNRIREIIRRVCPKLDDLIEQKLGQYLPKRTRRSVEDERQSLISYVRERVCMLGKYIKESPIYKGMAHIYAKMTRAYRCITSRIARWYNDAKHAFYEMPDIKQIAETYSELYDNSTIGYIAPRDAISRYIIKPRIEAWKMKAPVFEIDRKAGRFVADIDVPVDASDLIQYWAYGVQPKAKREEQEKIESTMEMINNALTKTFDGRASVIDGKHFVTFDGKHFSAAGECSYLLARDFVDGNFSVIMKTGDELSYIVQIGEKFVEINTVQQTVTINDQPIELPQFASGRHEFIVSRTEDIIQIKDTSALQFTVYLERSVATLDLRVWYFGRTAGLFGNYNREPSDDMMAPNGELVDGEQQLLRNWETVSGCRSRTMLFTEKANQDSDEYDLCNKFFKQETSTLAAGFWLQSTDNYYDLCLRAAHQAIHKTDAVCKVATAYLLEIEQSDLPAILGARLPNECLTCKVPQAGSIELGRTEYLEDHTAGSADIVFVIQENFCNQRIINEIGGFVRSLEKELTSQSVRQNRYAIVSFGGARMSEKAYMRTSGNQVFFSANDMTEAAKNISMSSYRTGDVFHAILMAITDYRYRPGVTKSIVVFACHSCTVRDPEEADYSDLRTALLERGISLHFVNQGQVRLRTSATRNKIIYGLDAGTVFSGKDINQKDIIGQPEMRVQVIAPKDLCVSLAQESHGSFFSSAHYESEGKAWRTVFARRVAKDVALSESCQRCDCVEDQSWQVKTLCRPCQARQAPAFGDYQEL